MELVSQVCQSSHKTIPTKYNWYNVTKYVFPARDKINSDACERNHMTEMLLAMNI